MLLIPVAILTGATVHPIQKGISVLTDKPVAKKTQEIVSQDKENNLWICDSTNFMTNNYLLASGAKIINSTNLYTNFDLYKTLYAAVVYFPEKHFFTLGQQLVFLTLVTAIPRAIWPGKPISIFETLKAEWLGQGAITGAWAYAQITEFYVEYGTIGAIVLMGIFGKICRNLKKSYRTPKTIHSLVAYSVTYPMLMQFVIRGYMPINFWIMFFMLVPVLVIKGFDKIEERES